MENSNLDPKNQQSNLSSSSSTDNFLNSKNIGTNQQPTNSVNAQNANLENQAPISNNFENTSDPNCFLSFLKMLETELGLYLSIKNISINLLFLK